MCGNSVSWNLENGSEQTDKCRGESKEGRLERDPGFMAEASLLISKREEQYRRVLARSYFAQGRTGSGSYGTNRGPP